MKTRKQVIIDDRLLDECFEFINESKGEIVDFTQLVRHSLVFYMLYKRKFYGSENIKFLDQED